MSLNDIDEALTGGGAKSAFKTTDQIGRRVGGTIISAELLQARKFDQSGKPTNELRYWDDGKPVNQVVIITQTTERDPADPEDDGRRAHYVKTWGAEKQRFTDAIQAAGYDKASQALVKGNEFYQTLIHIDPSTGIPRRDYNYEVIGQTTGAIDGAFSNGQAKPAPQPGAATQAAAQHVATADDDGKKLETARQLISVGQPDNIIAQVTGLDHAVIAALRNVPV